MDKYNFLEAKDAIFRLLADHCIPIEKDGVYYMSHKYHSSYQKAFQTLGIEQDEVPLMDFCQMWEENDRMIWTYWNFGYIYYGVTAQTYYNIIVENYLAWVDGVGDE